MAFNVNEFSGALKGGGARASLFQVQITNPINGVADAQVPFMVKAAQVPSINSWCYRSSLLRSSGKNCW